MNNVDKLIAAAASAIALTAGQASADPLNTMDDVGAALQACWSPPANTDGSSVTLSFSFKRDGSLIGPPRPTAIEVEGDEKERKAFVDTAIAAIENCLPLEFAPSLMNGIGGNVFTMEFSSPTK
jgi:hypothetical protein